MVNDRLEYIPKTIGNQSLENLTEKFNKVKEAGTKQEKLCNFITTSLVQPTLYSSAPPPDLSYPAPYQ